MAHALAGLVAEAGYDQFVVAPHRAVEEDRRSAFEPRFQIVSDVGTGSEEVKMLAARLVADPKSQRVADPVGTGGMRLAFQIPCALARHPKGHDLDARGRAVGQGRLERSVHFDWLSLHGFLVQHVKNAVGRKDRKHALMRIDGEGPAFTIYAHQ